MRTAAMWALLFLAAVPTHARAQVDACFPRVPRRDQSRARTPGGRARKERAGLRRHIALGDTYLYEQLLTFQLSR